MAADVAEFHTIHPCLTVLPNLSNTTDRLEVEGGDHVDLSGVREQRPVAAAFYNG
eukprot:CAMPEP_0174740834 /NCGR_PEP_ID=MMETSP1094-20130205/74612_1 /TAXON_ID=156173 /ORGANISM="Chrysochromulina brevifilum, Strain UTEX LB 985" /LENGTH=54 /DNA_ID=CAMNT_0015944613 /DNA_START=87 /DNA_END=248 /DNA_ORIENTATION=+